MLTTKREEFDYNMSWLHWLWVQRGSTHKEYLDYIHMVWQLTASLERNECSAL